MPTRAPGEPTPTPDTRPRLSLPGFQLVAPEAPPTATPQPRPYDSGLSQTPAGMATLTVFEPTPTSDPPLVHGGVVPGPSPVPGGAVQDRALGLRRIAPPPGSNLDDALRAASVVDKKFNKALSIDSHEH